MSEKQPSNRKQYQTHFSGHSLTKTHFTKQCDVKSIMETYNTTGIHTHANRVAARGGNSLPEWNQDNNRHANLNTLTFWTKKYNQIPQKELQNLGISNPKELFEYAFNPKNVKKAVEFGILSPEFLPQETPKETIQKVEIVEKKQPEPDKKGQAAA